MGEHERNRTSQACRLVTRGKLRCGAEKYNHSRSNSSRFVLYFLPFTAFMRYVKSVERVTLCHGSFEPFSGRSDLNSRMVSV
jgi:hypothetical protein